MLRAGGITRAKVIHSRKGDHVSKEALKYLRDAVPNTGGIFLLTTQSLLAILDDMEKADIKKHWMLVLDEAFQPVIFKTLHMGGTDKKSTPEERAEKRAENWSYLFDDLTLRVDARIPGAVFEMDKENAEAIKPVLGGDGGEKDRGRRAVYEELKNPALTSVVTTVIGDDPSSLPERIDVASFPNHKQFESFKGVTFLAALFEESLLYMIWTRVFGVKFEEHPYWTIERNLRDTHAEQGRFMEIGWVLDVADWATRGVLESPFAGTATIGALDKPNDGRVIERAIKLASHFCSGEQFLLVLNNWTGYLSTPNSIESLKEKVPSIGDVASTRTHGMNCYSQYNHIAVLAATNPSTPQAQWLAKMLDVPIDVVFQAYRIDVIYQSIGRISIRIRGNTERKRVLVLSKEDALFLKGKVFTDCKLVGKVGDIPRISKPVQEQDQGAVRRSKEYKRLQVAMVRAKKSGNTAKFESLKRQRDSLKSGVDRQPGV
jgi:hypothetical protein